jgi:protein-L-isoaspartate(D-aspartate) O-methyltransferase
MRMRGSLAGPERVVALAPGLSLLLPDGTLPGGTLPGGTLPGGTLPGDPDLEGADLFGSALTALLAGPSVPHPTGVRAGSTQVIWGLGLWLAAHEPRSCRLGEERTAASGGWLTGAPLRGPGWHSTLGLLDADGLAILAAAAEPERSGLVTLGAIGYGPGAARLAAGLAAHVRAWGEAGQPGIAGLHVDAYPRSSADDPRLIRDALVMERPGMRFAVYHD